MYKIILVLIFSLTIFYIIKIDVINIVNNPNYIKLKHLIPIDLKMNIKNSDFFKFFWVKTMTYTAKKKFNNKNILEKRNLILNNYILDQDQINYFKKEKLPESVNFITNPSDESKIIGARFYEINNYAIIEYTKHNLDNKKKLLIYIQGHAGNPYNKDYFINIKEHYKQKGFDVMSLSMSNLGFNVGEIDFPFKNNEKLHSMYYDFFDKKYPNKKPLSLMLSGNYYLIKNFLSNTEYEKIYMTGVSGGAWYTTFLASIIPEIGSSYAFAGTFPMVLRLFDNNLGDWEQSQSKVFDKIDYWDLYLLSTLDKFGKPTRKHYQIYNKTDSCCWRDPFASIMEEISRNLGNENFKVSTWKDDSHSIDTNFLYSQF